MQVSLPVLPPMGASSAESEGELARLKDLCAVNDPKGLYEMGFAHHNGYIGLPVDFVQVCLSPISSPIP
jgi:hypothetical protein